MVRRFGTIGQIAALAAMTAVERDVSAIDGVGRLLRRGVAGTLWSTAKALEVAGLFLSVIPAAGLGPAGSSPRPSAPLRRSPSGSLCSTSGRPPPATRE